MPTDLYDKARESFLKGEIAWATDDIRCILVDAGAYTVDLAAHQFLSSVPGGARIAVSATLTGKATAAGVADCDDILFSTVSGATIEAALFYQHTGVDATARLILYVDTGLGLPLTPNAGDVNLRIDNGANKLFKL